MTRTSLCLSLVLLVAAPLTVSEATPSSRQPAAEVAATPALLDLQKRLLGESRSLKEHSVYIETLDEGKAVAAFNEDITWLRCLRPTTRRRCITPG